MSDQEQDPAVEQTPPADFDLDAEQAREGAAAEEGIVQRAEDPEEPAQPVSDEEAAEESGEADDGDDDAIDDADDDESVPDDV